MLPDPITSNCGCGNAGQALPVRAGPAPVATAVAAIRGKLVRSPVRVSLPGGDLDIAWTEGGSILMTGPATEAFRGTFDWGNYAQ